MHRANWVILKTNASINKQLKSVIFTLNIVLLLLTIFLLIIWEIVNPNSLDNFVQKPYLIVFPLIYLTGITGLFFVKKNQKETTSFLFSSLVIFGGVSSSLASMFPAILPSSNTINPSLTIYNTTANTYGLSVASYWGIIGLILILSLHFKN